MNFKHFLLNESSSILSARVGDILSFLHDIEENLDGMGSKEIIDSSERAVNQMRRILHTHWSKEEFSTLKKIQKLACAIMRAIDTKADLPDVLRSVVQELESMTGKRDEPVNNL